ncbi:NADPH:quinone oxidoreductase family protein [Sulfitobacter donghicola]|uniref:NADPH:quinone oxidoreductase n=1 Tax=Sulfitobacter donghicola DSW-25 = KCTC 12864 = JCM 14565 TaxID=1300350 RepID=A0A073IEE8_9RHOB|nr:NADPH:quinone oxidoreductase family protein [Sulfitobacter donghicola]KEJ88733.1 NADPH:quinone oxidoreductase [Sulfitobacter donghicola DSW-25 = KCTC 12864 = JCM 14565]KIN68517.1 Oxidoreductase, zinc-binding dehydrogenase family [Sulfitobacter donghicola DSW-25 = KCTC 12864 = JCM 14565]
MRAMQVTEHNSPLALQTLDTPMPAAGEVQVQVATCGLNFGDTLLVKGSYQEKPALPFTPGMELAGTITAVGEGVEGLEIGQRVVAYSGIGGLAEYAVLSAKICVPLPDQMSFEDAAAFLITYGTSHLALGAKAGLLEGERLLVLGASGGVGLTAVELGHLMGAEVIACARGADRLAICAQKGADHLIDSDTQDIRETVKALGGADVVYDPIGGDQFKAAMRASNQGARLLPLGFASGEVPQIPANILLVKNMTVLGFYLGGFAKLNPKAMTQSIETLIGWYVEGKLKPHVSNVLPLEKANEGLDLLRTRQATGKVVVQVAS